MLMTFMIYGSYGFLGDIITHLAVNSGLRPILAGRDVTKLERQATGLSLEYRVFGSKVSDFIKDIFFAPAFFGKVLFISGPLRCAIE